MKKIQVIFLVVIFILANIATFLFAQGRIKLVEKIVTIYKNVDTEESSLPIVTESAKAKVKASVKAESSTARGCDFDDSDYLVGGDNAEFPEAAEITAGTTDVEKVKEVNAKTPSTAGTGHQNISSDSSNTQASINPSAYIPPAEGIYVADDGIAMPQLPLCDRDFESDVDNGGLENIALPQLPDIS